MSRNSSKFKKAIISGWNLEKMKFWGMAASKTTATPYGKVDYFTLKDCVFIPRHGIKENIPPHRTNHHANIFAVKKLGVKHIFAINSVGSLKKTIKPGDFVVASDYISWDPPTFFEKKAQFVVPGLSLKLGEVLIEILKRLKMNFIKQGVYFQTKGPRFETKAEIRMLSKFGDVVGMTMASEATLSNELCIEYTSLCSVDNYAHGVVEKTLKVEEFRKNQLKMAAKIEKLIDAVINTEIQ